MLRLVLSLALLPLALTAQMRPAQPGPGFHAVALPAEAGAGPEKEVKVLLETPHLKLATITLRAGTVLEDHAAPMPVTIQSLSGDGVVVMGETEEALSPERMVVLAPNVRHAVRPAPGKDLVLLVHHMKTPARPRAGKRQAP